MLKIVMPKGNSIIRGLFTGAVSALFLLQGCEQAYQPKQVGYHKIDLPAAEYQLFDSASFPYSFEYNKVAKPLQDKSKNAELYWLDLKYPSFDADVQITYKPVNGNMAVLHEYIEEVRLLANKHNVKASMIAEQGYQTADGHKAYIFLLGGQVPTQFQFYTTDSAKHFFRGALYFKMADRNDSLQPVIDYISKDMERLLSTLKFKK